MEDLDEEWYIISSTLSLELVFVMMLFSLNLQRSALQWKHLCGLIKYFSNFFLHLGH